MATSKNIPLKNVILSYPNIYTHELYKGEPTDSPQYSAVLLFDDQDTYDRLWEIGMEIAKEEFGSEKKIPKNLKSSERVCINEVSLDKDEDGIDFEGWSIKAKSGTLKSGAAKRIATYDRGNNVVTDEDGSNDGNGIFYPGAHVDAQISLWTSKKYPHMRSNLILLRFASDGEVLGGNGGPSHADMLDELGDADAEADI